MPPTGVSMAKWKSDGMRDEFRALFDILQRYDLAHTIDGHWYDKVTGSRLRTNHVACMMRRDYLATDGKLTGKELKKHIDALLRATTKVTNRVVAENRGDRVDITVNDNYL